MTGNFRMQFSKFRILFVLLLPLFFPESTTGQDTTRVLFIGNSYMYFNDLPGLFANMAGEGGEHVSVAAHMPGGASVGDTIQGTFAHMYNPQVYDLIRSEEWDYLFLQDRQSRFCMGYGVFPGDSRVIEGHLKIRDSLLYYHPCAKMLWFAGFGPSAGYPPFAYSGEALIDSIYRNYQFLRDTAGQVIVPVGPAFLRIMEDYPAIDLWDPDGSHPSLSGSWLIASTLFSTVFKRSPVDSPANPGLPESVDSVLKTTGFNTVTDSLFVTGLSEITPEIQINGNTLQVTGLDSCAWYRNFQPSSLSGCQPEVIQPGFYHAVVYDDQGCRFRTFPVSAGGSVNTHDHPATENKLHCFPVPVEEEVKISGPPTHGYLIITDVYGRIVFNHRISDWPVTLNIPEWPSGLYTVRVILPANKILTGKLIKN